MDVEEVVGFEENQMLMIGSKTAKLKGFIDKRAT